MRQIQEKLVLVRISGEFELPAFELSGFNCILIFHFILLLTGNQFKSDKEPRLISSLRNI